MTESKIVDNRPRITVGNWRIFFCDNGCGNPISRRWKSGNWKDGLEGLRQKHKPKLVDSDGQTCKKCLAQMEVNHDQ